MTIQRQLPPVLFLMTLCIATTNVGAAAASKTRTPNVVLIMADDLGYGDLGCFGNTTIRTPHLDRLASQGVKLTHSVAAATMCTPSRAAFMTGRYSIRSGMLSPHFFRIFPFIASSAGLPTTELTFGKVAKKAGYRTAFLGKWHLGWSLDRSDPDHSHPLIHGFDYFYGTPLTNVQDFDDNYRPILLGLFPRAHLQLSLTFIIGLVSTVLLVRKGFLWLGSLTMFVVVLFCGCCLFLIYNAKLVDSIFFRNYDIAEQPIHLPSVTRKLVKESQEFLLARHADHAPFLLFLSWLHLHTALATAPDFVGRSVLGPYGDAVEEMDWGVGQVMETLERLGMADNTLVYFTSDHGADSKARDWLGRVAGGYNGPFSGYKGGGSTEGSFRVPTMIKWPGHFPAGSVVKEPVSLMDVLPTVSEALDVDLDSAVPAGHVMDGRSLVPLLTGKEKVSPHEFLIHYCQHSIHAVTYRPRSGSKTWKLSFYEPDENARTFLDECLDAIHLDPPKLYDLTADPTAARPLRAEDHAQVVSAIMKGLKQHQDSVQEVPSQFTWWRILWQPWKQPCCDFPRCACEDVKFRGLFDD